MKIPIKIIFGVIYITMTQISLALFSIIIFIWDMNLKNVKKLYEDNNVFYISYCFCHEEYRYNTLLDYVFDKKDISKSRFLK